MTALIEMQSFTKLKPSPLIVSEEEYWKNYYNNSATGKIYEWNNGLLEEKGVSSYRTYTMYHWFILLLSHYLKTHPKDKMMHLNMAFDLQFSSSKTIRIPDIGIVSQHNPVPLKADDLSYDGTYDICIEAASDSNKKQLDRDVIEKKKEYAKAGVKEYYIIYEKERYVEFYQLEGNHYVPIPRIDGHIVQSQVLSGFQFSTRDLYRQPDDEEMITNPIYQNFVALSLQKSNQKIKMETHRADIAEQKVQFEKANVNIAEQRVKFERNKTNIAKQQIKFERNKANMAKQQIKFERNKVNIAKQQIKFERNKTKVEKSRADTAEEETERLKALLQKYLN